MRFGNAASIRLAIGCTVGVAPAWLCEDSAIATLLLLNGLPGIGKSTLARQVRAAVANLAVVEVDEFRMRYGAEFDTDEAKVGARRQALVAIEQCLAAGRDVIVPLYLGRPEFRESLAQLASDADARFVHVLIEGTPELAIERFRDRRARLQPGVHPESEIPDAAVETMILAAAAYLEGVRLDPNLVVLAEPWLDQVVVLLSR